MDVNGDGQADLLFSRIKLGFWRIVQNLISKRVKLDTSIYLFANNDRYPEEPSFLLKSDYKIDLTHRIRFRGTWPTVRSDFNKDGFADLLVARDGKIEVFLNPLNNDLYTKPLSQSDIMTSPFMQMSDLNGDGLMDLIFYEKKRNGSISLLLNKGNWEEAMDAADARQRNGAQ